MSQYATYADFLVFGMPETELTGTGLTESGVVRHLEAASGLADSLLKGPNYSPPFTAWGTELTDAVCTIAAYKIRAGRIGFNPDGDDANYRLMYNDAIAWLKRVGEQGGLLGTVDATESTDEESLRYSADAYSEPVRGWLRVPSR